MRIVGRTFECSKKPVEEKAAAPEAPPYVDEKAFDATEQLAEAGGFTLFDLERMTVGDIADEYLFRPISGHGTEIEYQYFAIGRGYIDGRRYC